MSELELAGDVPSGLVGLAPAEPPPAARRVADELLRRFGLGPAMQLDLAPGGLLNQNLFAVTARGAYFLKGYRYTDPAPIDREHRLIAHARRLDVPALAPLATPDGKTFLHVGGRFWAVFPRVSDGQPGPDTMTPPRAQALGRMLGRIHRALASVPRAEVERFPRKGTWDTAAAAREMAEYEAMIARRPVQDPFDQHTLASFGYRRTLMAGGVPAPGAFAALPAQVLHGDYHDRNVFFGADGDVSAVIDWELAAVGPRAWEIVRALDTALPLADDVETGGARLRAFVHGYASAAVLTAEECTAMPDLYWAARVHSLWVYEEHYRKGSARTDRLAMEDHQRLHWLATHRERLGELLVAALAGAPGLRLEA